MQQHHLSPRLRHMFAGIFPALLFTFCAAAPAMAQDTQIIDTQRGPAAPVGSDDSTVGATTFQADPELSISPPSVSWSNGAAGWRVVTVTNSGGFVSSPVTVSLSSGSDHYDLQGSCGALAQGETCQLQVRPTVAGCGTYQGQITASAERGGTATASLTAQAESGIASGTEIGRFTHAGGNWSRGQRVKVGQITVPGICEYEIDIDVRARPRYNYPVPYGEFRDPASNTMTFRTRLAEGGYGNGNYSRIMRCGDGRNRHTFRTCARYKTRKTVQLPAGTFDVYFYNSVPRGGGATYNGFNVGFIARNEGELPSNLKAWFDPQKRFWSAERAADPAWLVAKRRWVEGHYSPISRYK